MPSPTTLLTFVAVIAVFAAVPGPSNLYVVAQGLRSGRRPALAGAVGCAIAAATWVTATTLGVAAVLASSAAALSALHYVGGAYLLYLAVRTWRARAERPGRDDVQIPTSTRRAMVQGFLAEITNPKVALFFLAFLPQFVHHGDGSTTGQLLVLGVVFCLVGLLSDSLYALASGALHPRAGRRPRLLAAGNQVSATLYLGLGVWSLWSGTRTRRS